MPTRIDHCPSCNGSLEIRELYCPECDIQIRGHFAPAEPSRLAQLTDEQEAFLRLFVLSRGNLSDVERSLGVSYPTVRARLDDTLRAMGFPTGGEDDPRTSPRQVREERRRILEDLREKRITADEAARRLAGHAVPVERGGA